MAQAQALPAGQGSAAKKIAIGLWAVFITYFVAMFFLNSVNIAQPMQVVELSGMALFTWIIALSALGSAVATLMFGKLSDVYERRSILLTSMSLFIAGTMLSAISTSMAFAIAARVVLMLGQGALALLCFSVIGDLFEPTARARWSGMLNVPAEAAPKAAD